MPHKQPPLPSPKIHRRRTKKQTPSDADMLVADPMILQHQIGNRAVNRALTQRQEEGSPEFSNPLGQRPVLAMQIGSLRGNHALQRMVAEIRGGMTSSIPNRVRDVQRDPDEETNPPALTSVGPATWSREDTRLIQRELRRLGLYRIRVDGVVGPMTESGLVEAFAGDEWRGLDTGTLLERLRAAQPVEGTRGEHALRYGEMFRDGVIDMTLGIGFDEAGNQVSTIERFQEVLAERQFIEDRDGAAEIYTQAGRTMGPSAFGRFFVRRDALTYRPPAGEERSIHAVVRLVYTEDGSQGGEASGAFREGMVQSDVAYYTGHGRYGSGPDFDRNMSYELLDEAGNVTESIEDYDVLEVRLRNEGRRNGRSAWQQFLWRERRGRINVIGFNAGNVFTNPQNLHAGEFGARLMYWNLRREGGEGATLATGPGGELAAGAEANPERRYRLLVFDGCRTQDYERSIRGTAGFGTHSADVLATRRTVNWGDEVNTLASFLDSVLRQQSAETIVRGMDAQQGPENRGGRPGGAYRGSGMQDNPVIQ